MSSQLCKRVAASIQALVSASQAWLCDPILCKLFHTAAYQAICPETRPALACLPNMSSMCIRVYVYVCVCVHVTYSTKLASSSRSGSSRLLL